MVMMYTVDERLHTTSWSWFWGNRCTLLTAISAVEVGCGGLRNNAAAAAAAQPMILE